MVHAFEEHMDLIFINADICQFASLLAIWFGEQNNLDLKDVYLYHNVSFVLISVKTGFHLHPVYFMYYPGSAETVISVKEKVTRYPNI